MRKIWNLLLNEWIKISRRTSILVIAALMVVAVFGLAAILGATVVSEEVDWMGDRGWEDEAMREQLTYLEKYRADLLAQLETADSNDLVMLENELRSIESELDLYRAAQVYDIRLMGRENYLAMLLRENRQLAAEQKTLTAIPEAERTDAQRARLAGLDTWLPQMERVLTNHRFDEYLELENSRIRANPDLTPEEKADQIDTNALWLRLDPQGEDAAGLVNKGILSAMTEVRSIRQSLLDNLDYTSGYGTPSQMTPEQRTDIQNQLAVLILRLERGEASSRTDNIASAVAALAGVGQFMVVLLMTILAGSAVSNEIATGSIKSLIISPARRWKIYTAKLLSLVTAGVVITVLTYAVVMLAQGLFFGFGSGTDYLYARTGVSGVIPFYRYQLARAFVQSIDTAMYMMLAFTLSILTRNTAVSVGLSIAVYFSSSIIRAFLTLFEGKAWVRFIPFSNMGLLARFFPFDESSASLGGLFGVMRMDTGTGLGFSLAYLAVLLFCLVWMGLDSFCRRDIK